MMQPVHSSRRRGSSLIIMLTTIAVGAVIVGLAVMVLIRVLAMNHAASEHLARTVTVARLGEQFRGDVAAALSAEVTEPAADQIDAGDRAKADAEKQTVDGNPANVDADQPVTPSQRLKLTLGAGHTITYDVHHDTVERTVENDGQRKHSETYAPTGLVARLPELVSDKTNQSSPQFARLRLERKPLVESHIPPPSHGVVIEAQVGRDHRFGPREARP